MSNTIKLKSSATPGKVPLSSDLASGEVAINTADGLLFSLVNGEVTPLNPPPPPHTHAISAIEGLEDLVVNLQARIEALEQGTVYQDDEETDMKLLSSSTKVSATEFVFDGLLDNTKYSTYLVVLENLRINDTEYNQKQIGIGMQQSGPGTGYWDGYGAFSTQVLANDGSSTAIAKEYPGARLIDEEFDNVQLSGHINITPSVNGLGAIQAHIETGNGPFRSAYLSCEWPNDISGFKIFSSAADVLSGTVHLYGLMK